MSGAGNTFSVVDNRIYNLDDEFWSSIAPLLCSQNKFNNLSTEGLLIINPSELHDFSVSFFNPDGSTGMMCGNGGRCAVFFAKEFNFFAEKDSIKFDMAHSIYTSEIKDGSIRLYFPPPITVKKKSEVETDLFTCKGIYVNVGSDHFCIDYDATPIFQKKDFRDFCIDTYAPKIRFHDQFKPDGVNVNIYKIENRQKVQLRTYERGVEAETGACGTGALSTALALHSLAKVDFPLKIIPPSLSELTIDFVYNDNKEIIELVLEGNAEIKGTAELDIS